MLEIEEYQLAWHPQQGPGFRFKLKGTSNWSDWVRVSAADLTAVALILNEKPVYFNRQTGFMSTGAEPAGS
jgi:hypothetical protein